MNDPLFGNKVASAILVSLLLIFGLPLLVHSLFGGGHGGGHSDSQAQVFPQYPITIQLAASDNGAEPVVDLGKLMAATEPAKGERAALVCKSCHTFERGGAHLQGPNLWNIIDRPMAGGEGYGAYSSTMQNFGGQWTYARLDQFLKNSQAFMPGSNMVQRIRKDDKRAAILVYLSTLSDSPVPFPAPLPEPPLPEPVEVEEVMEAVEESEATQ